MYGGAEEMSKASAPFLQLQGITLFGDVPTQTVGVVYCGYTTGLLSLVTALCSSHFQCQDYLSISVSPVFKTESVFLKPRLFLSEKKSYT
jgi:hypothetical protein